MVVCVVIDLARVGGNPTRSVFENDDKLRLSSDTSLVAVHHPCRRVGSRTAGNSETRFDASNDLPSSSCVFRDVLTLVLKTLVASLTLQNIALTFRALTSGC